MRWGNLDRGLDEVERLLKASEFEDGQDSNLVFGNVGSLMRSYAGRMDEKQAARFYTLADGIRQHLEKKDNQRHASRYLPYLFDLEKQLGQTEAMLKTAEELIAAHPDNLDYRFYRAEALRAAKDYAKADTAVREVILLAPASAQASRAHRILVEHALEQGNPEAALGRARLAFDTAADDKALGEAVQLMAQAMTARDSHLANANAFVLYQKHGEAGPDGKTGTEDDLPPFRQEITRELEPGFKTRLLEEAAKDVDPLNPGNLHRRGMLYLHAGEPEKALEAFRAEYLLVTNDTKAMERAADGLAAALRASTGRVFGASAFLDFQKYGKIGPDGKAGTADDIAVPFQVATANSNMTGGDVPPEEATAKAAAATALVNEAREAFQRELLKDWCGNETLAAGMRYASALVMAGREDEALGVAYSLFGAARDDRCLSGAAVAVASALRAKDMNLLRANQFLNYQKHGPAGEDGKKDTKDDLTNPLAGYQPVLPQDHAQWITAKAEALTKGNAWRDAGYAWLYACQPDKSLAALKRARSLCPFEERAINELTRDIVTALKAKHGDTFGAESFLAFQRFGPHGEDGKPGTKDDLNDPLGAF